MKFTDKMKDKLSSLRQVVNRSDNKNNDSRNRIANNRFRRQYNNSVNEPMMNNPYIVEKQDEEPKHKSKFTWLYSPQRGVRWDHDPIELRNLAQTEAWTGMMIQSIIKEVSKMPWQITEVGSKEKNVNKDEDPFNRDVKKAADSEEAERVRELFKNPNADHDYNDLVEMALADLLEIGSLAFIKDFARDDYEGNDLISNDPTLLNIVPTDPATFTKEYRDKTGVLSGFWQYDMSSGQRGNSRGIAEPMHFKPEELVWTDLNKRTNRRYGLPPVLMIKDQLELLNLTVDQEKLYFSKGSIPNGALIAEDWSIEDAKDVKEEFVSEASGDPSKMMMIPGISGGVDYIKFGYNYKDLQFLERKQWYAKIIAAVFQVPMSVVGLKPEEVNRSTFEGELENWRSNTLSFYLQKLERAFNDQIVKPHFGDDIRFEFIPGFNEDEKSEISQRALQEWNSNTITLNEFRGQLGYDEVENGDQYKHEFMPDQQQPEEGEGGMGIEGLLRSEEEGSKKEADEPLRGDADDYHLFNYQPSDVEDLKEEITPEVEELWDKILSNEEILDAIRRSAAEEKTEKSLTEISRKLKDLLGSTQIVDKLKEKIRRETSEQVDDALDDVISGTGEDIDKDAVMDRINNRDMTFADQYAERMEEEIRETVSEGWSDGKTVEEIKDELKEKADNFSDYEAERIARDQMQRATGDARNEFAKQHSDKYVEVWLATSDDRTRDAHAEMDDKWKRPNEAFVVDYSVGEQDGPSEVYEEFPGDSKHGIQCRCDTLLKPIEDVDDDDHGGEVV